MSKSRVIRLDCLLFYNISELIKMKQIVVVDSLGRIRSAPLSVKSTLGEMVKVAFSRVINYQSHRYLYAIDGQPATWDSIVTEENTTISVRLNTHIVRQ